MNTTSKCRILSVALLATPIRLKIISAVCSQERNVSELLAVIDTTQPNMSQHLNALFKAKILGRRREGVQIYYRLINEQVVTICRAMCQHVATLDDTEGDKASGSSGPHAQGLR